MNKFNKIDRKTFIASAGTAVFGAAFVSRRSVAANLNPASISIGHITDTFFGASDDPKKSGRRHPGWLYGHAFALADDLVGRFAEDPLGPADLLVHGGNLLRSGKPEQAVAALEWLNSQKTPVRPTLGNKDVSPLGLDEKDFISTFSAHGFMGGKAYYSYDMGGFHFIHLGSPVDKNREQLDWIRDDLAGHKNVPTIAVVPGPSSDDTLRGMFAGHDQVVVALRGGTLENDASFEAGPLTLTTCSPAIYPCGARMVKVDVSGGMVSIFSRFLQTRRLELVEKSFHQLHSRKNIKKLGRIKGRPLVAHPARKAVETLGYATNPSLAPVIGSDSNITLAVLADTHLCLDKYIFGEKVTQHTESIAEYEQSGHFIEKGSKAIYDDILDQVATGVHRVEFYDEVFDKNPQSEVNFLEAPVDALLLNGDMSEHGMLDESEIVREGLDRLPEKLRRATFVTPGNHDLFRGDFIEKDSASGKKPFTDFYKGYMSPKGSTYYTVQLAEWLTLVVLDSTIPTKASLGMNQDQIDWLEDQLARREKQAVIVACHHPIYHISQVPKAMSTYLNIRSHFTPKVTSARAQLHALFKKHNNLKLAISGHYHGTCTDQYRKTNPKGAMPDDSATTHIQVPCTVEYPNGYRFFKFSRSKNTARIEYVTAYTRRADLRAKSSRALIFKMMGADIKTPRKYENTLNLLNERRNVLRTFDRVNPMDLMEMNIRGYKDGTANRGRGNSGKNNINGIIEFSI